VSVGAVIIDLADHSKFYSYTFSDCIFRSCKFWGVILEPSKNQRSLMSCIVGRTYCFMMR